MKDKFIYMYTNKLNGHKYIGQTNDIKKRFNNHKSDSYNTKSKSYNLPLHNAIRKYGIENFSFEILESNLSLEKANEREKYWIKEKRTHISQGGYNVTHGEDGREVDKLTWEELKNAGKVFCGEEIEKIQSMLIDNQKYDDIIKEFSPRLTRTFLSNINNGINYKNPNLDYPLKKSFKGEGRFSLGEIQEIKEKIKKRISYSQIAKEHNIQSVSLLSGINTGKYYFDKNEKYPLVIKGSADKSWIKDCLYDVIFTKKSIKQIAQKHNKAKSTIEKLMYGHTNKQQYLLYPLRKNQERNKKIFQKYFI